MVERYLSFVSMDHFQVGSSANKRSVVDPAGRFMISASSSRGWVGESTRTVFVHDIKPGR